VRVKGKVQLVVAGGHSRGAVGVGFRRGDHITRTDRSLFQTGYVLAAC
jgi:hypothetical protein